jgi:hypothetical protein
MQSKMAADISPNAVGLWLLLDHTLKSDVTTHRLEVTTETGRRRWFSRDDKVSAMNCSFLSAF